MKLSFILLQFDVVNKSYFSDKTPLLRTPSRVSEISKISIFPVVNDEISKWQDTSPYKPRFMTQ